MATRKKATTAQEPPITAPVVFPKERVLFFCCFFVCCDLQSVLKEVWLSNDTPHGVIFCPPC